MLLHFFFFDPEKAAANLRKHGISFSHAQSVLFDPLSATIEDFDAKGEQRFVSIGRGSTGEVLVVVFTERKGDYRLISARRPTPQERKRYEA